MGRLRPGRGGYRSSRSMPEPLPSLTIQWTLE